MNSSTSFLSSPSYSNFFSLPSDLGLIKTKNAVTAPEPSDAETEWVSSRISEIYRSVFKLNLNYSTTLDSCDQFSSTNKMIFNFIKILNTTEEDLLLVLRPLLSPEECDIFKDSSLCKSSKELKSLNKIALNALECWICTQTIQKISQLQGELVSLQQGIFSTNGKHFDDQIRQLDDQIRQFYEKVHKKRRKSCSQAIGKAFTTIFVKYAPIPLSFCTGWEKQLFSKLCKFTLKIHKKFEQSVANCKTTHDLQVRLSTFHTSLNAEDAKADAARRIQMAVFSIRDLVVNQFKGLPFEQLKTQLTERGISLDALATPPHDLAELLEIIQTEESARQLAEGWLKHHDTVIEKLEEVLAEKVKMEMRFARFRNIEDLLDLVWMLNRIAFFLPWLASNMTAICLNLATKNLFFPGSGFLSMLFADSLRGWITPDGLLLLALKHILYHSSKPHEYSITGWKLQSAIGFQNGIIHANHLWYCLRYWLVWFPKIFKQITRAYDENTKSAHISQLSKITEQYSLFRKKRKQMIGGYEEQLLNLRLRDFEHNLSTKKIVPLGQLAQDLKRLNWNLFSKRSHLFLSRDLHFPIQNHELDPSMDVENHLHSELLRDGV